MIADEVAQFIAGSGAGTFGNDIFVAFMPESPDECIACYDVNTFANMNSSALSDDNLGVEIDLRSNDYLSIKAKQKLIHSKLMGFNGQLMTGGQHVTAVDVEINPKFIGSDEKNRYLFIVTYRLWVESFNDDHRL